MNYFFSTEIGIANLLQRQFDWAANTLFFEEIPNALDSSRNKFIVANDDVIISAPVSLPQKSRIYMKADNGMSHSASKST